MGTFNINILDMVVTLSFLFFTLSLRWYYKRQLKRVENLVNDYKTALINSREEVYILNKHIKGLSSTHKRRGPGRPKGTKNRPGSRKPGPKRTRK